MKTEERARAIHRAPQLLNQILLRGQYDFLYDQMPIRIRGMSWAQRINLVRSGLNFLHRRLKPWNYPLHIQFELTNYCQLRCPVCPTGTKELARKPNHMDPALFKRILSEIGPRLITTSLWGWGESLLHPSLGEMLAEARRYNAAVLLSTNGQNLDRMDVVEALIENPPTFLIVALDGLTDETNSQFRVGARLEPALRGVEMLVKERKRRGRRFPVLQMRFIAMKHNQHEISRAEEFARSWGFDMICIRMLCLIDSETGLRNQEDLAISLPETAVLSQQEITSGRRKGYLCMQPFWYPSVFVDGTLVACEQDFNAKLPLGTLNAETSFSSLWFGHSSTKVRRQIRDSYHEISFCRNCPVYARARTDSTVRAIWLSAMQQPVSIGE